jgi:magnesium-transporting ATPase (P-type)
MGSDYPGGVYEGNKRVFSGWLIAALIVSIISAIAVFVIQVNRKPPPAKPHILGQAQSVFRPRSETAFWAGLVVTVIGLLLAYNKIRRRTGPDGEPLTVPELSKWSADFKMTFYITAVAVALVVQFAGIWWEKAYLLFSLIPVFFLCAGTGSALVGSLTSR